MKLNSLCSLVLFLLFSSSLFAQFDGHNGQSSFYEEVEEENRPSFLQVEEENMLVERWQTALNTLGLENVSVLEEINLEELQVAIQQEWNQFLQVNQQLNDYIDQLESRNSQLQSLQIAMSKMMIDMEEENHLFTAMEKDQTEVEADIVNENTAEMQTLALELLTYQMEIEQNEGLLVQQINALLENEAQLSTLTDEKEAVMMIAAAKQQHLLQYTLTK